jgi:metal-responsive CopG/Arc/MetJ family transcriptional regulator
VIHRKLKELSMQVTTNLPADLGQAIENIRFEQRYTSRNAAIVDLLKAGLAVRAERPAQPTQSAEVRS